jgi:DNA-binding CsgD family transcriptional regulator
VFKLLAQGLSGAEIAQRLMLSAETVRTHVRNGSKRLAARTRVHAIVLAVKNGEIEL